MKNKVCECCFFDNLYVLFTKPAINERGYEKDYPNPVCALTTAVNWL